MGLKRVRHVDIRVGMTADNLPPEIQRLQKDNADLAVARVVMEPRFTIRAGPLASSQFGQHP